MTVALLAGIAGLALLDSLNPATIVAVTLILIAAPKHPGPLAGVAVLGAAITVFCVGAALFLTAGAAAGAVDGIVIALRYLAFGAAGIALVVAGIRRLTDRPRQPITLPAWFSPWTALPFGVLLTAADLPNAFPYFIAIERLVSNEVSVGVGLAVIAGYTVIYCLPCLILLTVGLIARDRVRSALQRLVDRFGTGTVKRSAPIAIIFILLGIGVGSIPFGSEPLSREHRYTRRSARGGSQRSGYGLRISPSRLTDPQAGGTEDSVCTIAAHLRSGPEADSTIGQASCVYDEVTSEECVTRAGGFALLRPSR
ncbi:GAP family protein [Microbacterium sp. HJ5]